MATFEEDIDDDIDFPADPADLAHQRLFAGLRLTLDYNVATIDAQIGYLRTVTGIGSFFVGKKERAEREGEYIKAYTDQALSFNALSDAFEANSAYVTDDMSERLKSVRTGMETAHTKVTEELVASPRRGEIKTPAALRAETLLRAEAFQAG